MILTVFAGRHRSPAVVLRNLVWWCVLLIAAQALAANHKLRVTDPALAKTLVDRGGKLVADYGAFQLIETDDATPANRNDRRAENVDDLNVIHLNARPLDTRDPQLK